jgi:PIN domain nuclease of toxin-antitoxin system
VKVLLDTHVWIWWLLGCERLSVADRRSLDRLAGAGGCHLSAMSLWEAQMLHSKGRLSRWVGPSRPGYGRLPLLVSLRCYLWMSM